jgi:hypothetical protein
MRLETINRVPVDRYFPGMFLKKGFLVRITNTIIEAEITDSINQPVMNQGLYDG